jgi:hypothetical protein
VRNIRRANVHASFCRGAVEGVIIACVTLQNVENNTLCGFFDNSTFGSPLMKVL